jgi:DNA-3-methyladenine glycosylase
MHWCVNAVTRAEGLPSAVLIRAVEPLEGIAFMRRRRLVEGLKALCDGPAKLCQAFAIDGRKNEADLSRGPLRILSGNSVPERLVQRTARVGISRARDWPLRWIVADG